MKIAFLPIDNRPVCYTLPEQIAAIDKAIKFSIPERDLLGDLTKGANVEGLFKWLMDLPPQDAIILSLDTIAYGGLIPSRRSTETFEQIEFRLSQLKVILKSKNAKIYAFSSIMRISNNNVNEEEKEYWKDYGKKIFEYSYQAHKSGMKTFATEEIPSDILEDYLTTRKRNFEVNKIYLDWQKEGLFDTLVFSKDDCAEYGLNVCEAHELEKLGGFTKTGADEIPLTLFACAVKSPLKIAPIFLEPEYKHLISNYEDVSIEKSVEGQIELAGCVVSEPEDADILLYVNNFVKHQGEIVMKVPTKPFDGVWENPESPYMIADVRFANGSDNAFVEQFIKTSYDENFYGYSGWNTSANTLGSLICAAKVKFSAKDYDEDAFKTLQAVRLLDDWGYQANTRQSGADLSFAVPAVNEFLGTKFILKNYIYPWDRSFEVEIIL